MDLHEAFSLGTGEVVSIVGGGGKTTLLYRLANEIAAAGGRAIVTGTTRFTPPAHSPMPFHVFSESKAIMLRDLQAGLEREQFVVAGTGWGNKGRIMPVDPEWLAAMLALPSVSAVLAEADGSAGRPFKAPAEHEPVVSRATTLLITVVGIDILGKPLVSEKVHRPEIVARLSGAQLGDPIDRETVARVLLDGQGGRKGLPRQARWLPVLNKVETAAQLEDARRIAWRLLRGGASRIVIARAAHEPPVVEVVE